MIREFLRLLSFLNRKIFNGEFIHSLGASRILFYIIIAPWIILMEFYGILLVIVTTWPIYIVKALWFVIVRIVKLYKNVFFDKG